MNLKKIAYYLCSKDTKALIICKNYLAKNKITNITSRLSKLNSILIDIEFENSEYDLTIFLSGLTGYGLVRLIDAKTNIGVYSAYCSSNRIMWLLNDNEALTTTFTDLLHKQSMYKDCSYIHKKLESEYL